MTSLFFGLLGWYTILSL